MPKKPREIPWIGSERGVYYVYWYDHSYGRTRRKSLKTDDVGEAQKAYAAFLAGERPTYQKDAALTVSDALDQYYHEHVAEKVADKMRQENAIEHLKEYFGGERALSEITIPVSRGYIEARRSGTVGGGRRRKDKTGSDATIRRELNVLVAAANHALKWRRITVADMPVVERPSEKRAGVAPWLTRGELDALVESLSGDLLDFVVLCYYTGSRRKAIETLEAEQVDLDAGVIRLAKDGEPVTKKRRPPVPVFGPMVPVLERRMEIGFFGGRDFYRPFRQACEDLGYHDRAHPHVLRHSRATHLLQAGKPIYDVARLLGDTVATVERVYGHHSPANLRRSLEL